MSDCVAGVRERDKSRYCVLESNGSVWVVKSLLAIKGQVDLGLSLESEVNKSPVKSENKSEQSVVSKVEGVRISLAEQVQKLPVGQSMITVVEAPGQKAIMQVKLPPTLTNQYWSLISVGVGQTSIQCPDSSLVLKCAILQQAAGLSSETSTTVRIPIPVEEQDPSFGVYAVPGLRSHVFVGPFAAPAQDDDDDIVCLEDEVEVIEPNKEDEKNIKAEEEANKKKELSQKMYFKRKALGQIPQRVQQEEMKDDLVDVDNVEAEVKKSQAKQLKLKALSELVKDNVTPPTDLKPSFYGKIVRKKTDRAPDSISSVDVQYKYVGEEKSFSAIMDNITGHIIIFHPKYSGYEVICPSADSASNWLEEYFEGEISEEASDEVVFDDPEPLPDNPPAVKSPPPILKKLNIPFLQTKQASDKKINLFLQYKQQKNEAQLLYELGHTAFSNFFTKNVSKLKILRKALEQIKILQAEAREMEQSKQNLLKRRKKLFEMFTKSLNGLPVAKKKSAVLELKEQLRKDKERKNKSSASSTISTTTQSSSTATTSSITSVSSSSTTTKTSQPQEADPDIVEVTQKTSSSVTSKPSPAHIQV